MSSLTRYTALAAATLCAAVLAAPRAAAQDANLTGRVAGVLVDEQGQPVGGMKIKFVRLDDPKGKSPEVTTNKKGRFSIGFFPTGVYRPELQSDEVHIGTMKFQTRTQGGPGGPGVEEGGAVDDKQSLMQGMENRELANRGASVDAQTTRQGERKSQTGSREEDLLNKAESNAQATAAATAKAGPTYFTVKMGTIVDMTLTTAKGKAVKIDPATGTSEVAGFLKAAHDAFDAGDMPAVIAAADKALAVEANNGMATFLKGLALARQDKMEEAIPTLRRARELLPNQKNIGAILGSALLGRADKLEEAGNAGEAKPLYTEAADLLMVEANAPDAQPSLLSNAIYALNKAGRGDEALAATKKLVDANPTDVPARLRYVEALRASGRKDEAATELKAITVPEGDTMNTLRLAEAYTLSGDAATALKMLEPIPVDTREAASVLYNAAVGMINAGKPELALPALERAVAGQPELAFLHRTLGLTYLNGGRLEDGARELKEALRLEPTSATAETDKQILAEVEASLKKKAAPAGKPAAAPKKK